MRYARFSILLLGLGLASAIPLMWTMAEEQRQQDQLHQAALLVRAEFALECLGYRIDAPDGLSDERTDAALAHFRRGAGMLAGGSVNAAQVEALEAAAKVQAEHRLALYMARHEAEERLVRADLLTKVERRLAGW